MKSTLLPDDLLKYRIAIIMIMMMTIITIAIIIQYIERKIEKLE